MQTFPPESRAIATSYAGSGNTGTALAARLSLRTADIARIVKNGWHQHVDGAKDVE